MTNQKDAGHRAAADGPPAVPRLVTSLCAPSGSCPTVYATGRDTVLVQGYAVTEVSAPEGEFLVEIPRELLIEAARRLQEQDA